MKRLLSGLIVGLLGTAFAEGRTVSVSSFDRATGVVELALESGAEGAADQALIAAWNPGDAGADATAWRETDYVGTVQAGTTSVTYALPADWLAKSGAVRFFLMEKTAPYAKRFDFVTANGNWVDTGLIPETNVDVRVTATYRSGNAPFGVATRCYLFSTEDTNLMTVHYHWGFFGASAQSTISLPRGTDFHEYRISAAGAFVDGERCATWPLSSCTERAYYAISLFARRDNASGGITKTGTCSISAATILTNGVVAQAWVPCQSPGGLVTVYDRVNGTFAAIQGGGAFSAGTEICPDPQDCGGLAGCTDVLLLAPTLTVASRNLGEGTVTVTLDGAHDDGFLVAVAGATDVGTVYADWPEATTFTRVSADESTATATLPTDWWNNGWQVRFLWISATDLPYDYPVESVYTAGSAYANDGWIPSVYTEEAVRARCGADVCHFGLTVYFYLFDNGGATFYGFFGNTGSFATYRPNLNTYHELRLGPSGAYIDGVQKVAFTGATYQNLGKASPVPFRRNAEDGSLTKSGPCHVQYAKVWDDGILVRDLVPCVKDGVAGFLDRVHRKFHASVVSTPFEAGEKVAPPITAGDVLAWSGALSLASEVSGVWDGGGSDRAFDTAANWEGDMLPDLTDGTGYPTFASAGSEAVLTGPVNVRGIKVNAKNDFQISASAAANVLALGVSGIALEDDPSETLSTSRMLRLACPVLLSGNQTWDLSPNAQRRIQLTELADLRGSSNVTLTVTGGGVLGLVATNSFAGDVQIAGGKMKVLSHRQPFGTGDEGGRVFLDMLSAKWEMYGAVMDKPLVVSGGNATSANFTLSSVAGGPTNYFTAPLTVKDATLRIKCDAPTVFEGPCDFQQDVSFTGENRAIIFRGPAFQSFSTFDVWGTRALHFHTPSNRISLKFDGQWGNGSSTVNCWADYVFHNYDSALTLGGSTVVDLHGHSQNFGCVQIKDSGCRVRSDAPADFFAFNNNSEIPTTTFKGVFEGQVNLVKSGLYEVVLGARNTSTGFLRVQNGLFTITNGCCWAGTRVEVGALLTNRQPKLRLLHDGCFADGRNTTLVLTTSTASQMIAGGREPLVEIAEGVRQVFGEAWLDGRRLAGGTWGSSESPADHKDDAHFKGKGMIYVRGEGSVIVVR